MGDWLSSRFPLVAGPSLQHIQSTIESKTASLFLCRRSLCWEWNKRESRCKFSNRHSNVPNSYKVESNSGGFISRWDLLFSSPKAIEFPLRETLTYLPQLYESLNPSMVMTHVIRVLLCSYHLEFGVLQDYKMCTNLPDSVIWWDFISTQFYKPANRMKFLLQQIFRVIQLCLAGWHTATFFLFIGQALSRKVI